MSKPLGIEDVRKAVSELSERGIEPLDLFSWVYLLDLHARYGKFDGIDLDMHYRMQDDINRALWRKARMLDQETGKDDHGRALEILGVPKADDRP